MSRPALYLLAVSASCAILGLTALVSAWSNPGTGYLTFLATAAGWPWLLAVLLGARIWLRRQAGSADPFEHFLAVYAAGTAAALVAGAATLTVAGWKFPVMPCPDTRLLAAPCAMVVSMSLAALAAGLTLGFVFPALLPVAAAALSAAALRGEAPSKRRLRIGVAGVASCWLVAAVGGLVLAHG